jgi:hypothetical protein
MENKYYVPKIEEFYIGFECEFKNKMQSNKWETVICDQDMISIVYDRIEHSENFKDEIRVKHLDEQDIQDLGFTKETKHRYSISYSDVSYKLYFLQADAPMIIKEFQPNDNYESAATIFNGTIKNKSELKRIMQMLKIIE